MQKIKRYFQQFNRFHDESNGNAMIFVVLVLFTLVCFFVFTIHIGQRFTNKVEMQNAADAAAISGAVWKARGMNMISILNVSMSECLALIIMFMAFDSTVDYTNDAIPATEAAASECLLACLEWWYCIQEQEEIFKEIHVIINEEMRHTWQLPETLWEIMGALKQVSDVVSETASLMAYLDASNVAERNGASALFDSPVSHNSVLNNFLPHATLWPYRDSLPVKDGTFEEDLCDHTIGGGEGYNNYLCYENAFDVEVNGRDIDSEIENLWGRLDCITEDPDVTNEENHTPLQEYREMRQAHFSDLCSGDNASSGSDANNDPKKVPPLVLADDWEDDVRFTSLVLKIENTLNSTYFLGYDGQPVLSLESNMSGEMITYGEDGDSALGGGRVNLSERTWAVARAEVYNPGEKDLFNQNWHAKLMPVDVTEIQPTYLRRNLNLPDRMQSPAIDSAQQVMAH
jgi:hypothetical protein